MLALLRSPWAIAALWFPMLGLALKWAWNQVFGSYIADQITRAAGQITGLDEARVTGAITNAMLPILLAAVIAAAIYYIGRHHGRAAIGEVAPSAPTLKPARLPFVDFREEIIARLSPDADVWTRTLDNLRQAAVDSEVAFFGRKHVRPIFKGSLAEPLVRIPPDYFVERFMPALEAIFKTANKAVFTCKGSGLNNDPGPVYTDIHLDASEARAWLEKQAMLPKAHIQADEDLD